MAEPGVPAVGDEHAVLVGRRLRLRPFGVDDIGPRYLAWLGDDEVNRYSRRYGQPVPSAAEAREWLEGLPPDEVVLAIEATPWGHVGNIKYGPVDRRNARADISLLIGERDCWGQGIGRGSMYILCRYLFRDLGLHRVDAGTGNPAFARLVEKLGWQREGTLRERVRLGDRWVDWTLWSLLDREFHDCPEYEPEG